MNILGIETSCDECSVAVVQDGKNILSNVVVDQVERHAPWNGVVPEIASRLHVEWIDAVSTRALEKASLDMGDIDAIAVTSRPGLVGSLLVGLSYAKGLAWSAEKPWVGVDHVLAHLYAPHLEYNIDFPYLGLVVSGGHTVLCVVRGVREFQVLGTSIDDACGEAFDKVAKHYDMGYPGGVFLDRLAENGNPNAFNFPMPQLNKENHRYDVSYSGIKTAAINQLKQFHVDNAIINQENIAASFRKIAIDMLLNKVELARKDSGINRIVVGGGVSANAYLRRLLSDDSSLESYFPSMELCTDNGAMIAGLGFHCIMGGECSPLNLNALPRVREFRHSYSKK